MKIRFKIGKYVTKEKIIKSIPQIFSLLEKAKNKKKIQEELRKLWQPHSIGSLALAEEMIFKPVSDALFDIEKKIFENLGLSEIRKSENDSVVEEIEKTYGITLSDNFDNKTAKQLLEALKEIPAKVLKGHVKSIILDERMGKSKRLYPNHGKYIEAEKKIMLNPEIFDIKTRYEDGKGHSISKVTQVAVHEIGHVIDDANGFSDKKEWTSISGWGKIGSDKPDKGYKRLVLREKDAPTLISPWQFKAGTDFVRWYAKRNPKEDFVESFCFAVTGLTGRFNGETGKQKLAFLNKYVLHKFMEKIEKADVTATGKPPSSGAKSTTAPKVSAPKVTMPSGMKPSPQKGKMRAGHKYLRREGQPGDYTYYYKDTQGKIISSKVPLHDEGKHKPAFHDKHAKHWEKYKKKGAISDTELAPHEQFSKEQYLMEAPITIPQEKIFNKQNRNLLETILWKRDFSYSQDYKNGVNSAVKVTIKGDGEGMLKSKVGERDSRIKGENIRQTVADKTQYLREILAYKIDTLLGFDVVPQTVEKKLNADFVNKMFLKKKDIGTPASLQYFVQNAKTFDDLGWNWDMFRKNTKKGDRIRLAMFDFITGASDRHAKNFMRDDKGKIYAIDNGLNFAYAQHNSAVVSMERGKKIPKDILDKFEKLYKQNKDKIEKTIKESGIEYPDYQVKIIFNRMDKLLVRKTIPNSWESNGIDKELPEYEEITETYSAYWKDFFGSNFQGTSSEESGDTPDGTVHTKQIESIPENEGLYDHIYKMGNFESKDFLSFKMVKDRAALDDLRKEIADKMPVGTQYRDMDLQHKRESFEKEILENMKGYDEFKKIKGDRILNDQQKEEKVTKLLMENLNYKQMRKVYAMGMGGGDTGAKVYDAMKNYEYRYAFMKNKLNKFQGNLFEKYHNEENEHIRYGYAKELMENMDGDKRVTFIKLFNNNNPNHDLYIKDDAELRGIDDQDKVWKKIRENPDLKLEQKWEEYVVPALVAGGGTIQDKGLDKWVNEIPKDLLQYMYNVHPDGLVKKAVIREFERRGM
jgi:hypothetical protein